MKKSKDFKWRTKEGKVLLLSEMEDSHIENCIKMLGRQLATMPEIGGYIGDGEMAQMCADAEDAHNMAIENRLVSAIQIMKRELKGRSLINSKGK